MSIWPTKTRTSRTNVRTSSSSPRPRLQEVVSSCHVKRTIEHSSICYALHSDCLACCLSFSLTPLYCTIHATLDTPTPTHQRRHPRLCFDTSLIGHHTFCGGCGL
jgi:hypothetical protein